MSGKEPKCPFCGGTMKRGVIRDNFTDIAPKLTSLDLLLYTFQCYLDFGWKGKNQGRNRISLYALACKGCGWVSLWTDWSEDGEFYFSRKRSSRG